MLIHGSRLKKLRENKRISQAELADRLQLSQATIWDWEKKNSNVKLEYLLRLTEIFQVDINELLVESDAIDFGNRRTITSNEKNSTIEVSTEAYELQKDLIIQLKKHIFFLESEIKRLNRMA